jgi:hypothetical protein
MKEQSHYEKYSRIAFVRFTDSTRSPKVHTSLASSVWYNSRRLSIDHHYVEPNSRGFILLALNMHDKWPPIAVRWSQNTDLYIFTPLVIWHFPWGVNYASWKPWEGNKASCPARRLCYDEAQDGKVLQLLARLIMYKLTAGNVWFSRRRCL